MLSSYRRRILTSKPRENPCRCVRRVHFHFLVAMSGQLQTQFHRDRNSATGRCCVSMLAYSKGRCRSTDPPVYEEKGLLHRRRWQRCQHDPSRRCRYVLGDSAFSPIFLSRAILLLIGVGIVGKEGKQASLAADFSINQFSFLTKLLLWHGRNSYKRSAKLAQFVIHRGLIISVIQAVFSSIFFFARE